MAKIVDRCRVHCPIRHVSAFVLKWDDGSVTIKCGFLRACGDSCPFLRNPDYKSPFRRAPEYKPK